MKPSHHHEAIPLWIFFGHPATISARKKNILRCGTALLAMAAPVRKRSKGGAKTDGQYSPNPCSLTPRPNLLPMEKESITVCNAYPAMHGCRSGTRETQREHCDETHGSHCLPFMPWAFYHGYFAYSGMLDFNEGAQGEVSGLVPLARKAPHHKYKGTSHKKKTATLMVYI